MKYIHYLFLCITMLLTSCGTGISRSDVRDGDTLDLHFSENLTIVYYDDYTKVILRHPWDTTKVLQTYLLVPRENELPDSLPMGVVLRTPVQNALIFSSVHCSLLCELGAESRIGGVCDPEYLYNPALKSRLQNGTLTDCGNSMSPNYERIIQLHPDVIGLSPYENSNGFGKLDKLNIPILLCADYMETSPLGRAEWMKFYGMIFGQQDEAFRIFDEVSSNYLSLKEKTQTCTTRPKVLSDTRYRQVWYMPGGNSTMGQLYEDAGANNPFGYLSQSGSAPLSAEQVYEKAHDADVWIIKYNQPIDMTLRQLSEEDAFYKQFKPFKEGKVYGSNTSTSKFFEETPYHPDKLLSDFIQIFHPELHVKKELQYFKLLRAE